MKTLPYTITSHDIQIILESNKKATEIYIETERQNEEILETLKEIQDKAESTDKYLFRLTLILGGTGIATIIEIIKLFLNK